MFLFIELSQHDFYQCHTFLCLYSVAHICSAVYLRMFQRHTPFCCRKANIEDPFRHMSRIYYRVNIVLFQQTNGSFFLTGVCAMWGRVSCRGCSALGERRPLHMLRRAPVLGLPDVSHAGLGRETLEQDQKDLPKLESETCHGWHIRPSPPLF